MIPLGDDNSDRIRTPYVNIGLILLNMFVFVFYQSFGSDNHFTAMFMHGGLAHLGGNLLYLWVFGDNLENRMGHLRYLLFYLLTGIIATLCHVGLCYLLQKDLYTPSLGASGAISGVLGGYLLLFPKNQVKVLFIALIIRVPAFVTLGLWIALQLFSGWGSLGEKEGGGGVAYAAHIGGFVAGLLLVRYFAAAPNVK